MDKDRKSAFGDWVDKAIHPLATVVEVGCGTGQVTNFLGLVSTRTVIGADMSGASLVLGQGFRNRFGLDNVHFVQGNIFQLPIAENAADVLICSGVRELDRLVALLPPGLSSGPRNTCIFRSAPN